MDDVSRPTCKRAGSAPFFATAVIALATAPYPPTATTVVAASRQAR